jgi:hypothetical protein
MAISDSAIWAVSQLAVSSAAGGHFDPSQTLTTQISVTGGDTSTPVITSSTYDFTSNSIFNLTSVGRRVFIKSGGNFIPGWYLISSISGNSATLDAAVGQVLLYNPFSRVQTTKNTSVGCSTTATTSGGLCAFYLKIIETNIPSGVHSASGATATISAISSNSIYIGNGVYITSGTNGIVGFYTIVSAVDGVSLTLDRAVTTGSSSDIAFRIGGNIKDLTSAESSIVSGKGTIYRNGAFIVSSTTQTTSNSSSFDGGFNG